MKICQGTKCCSTGVLDSPGSDFDYGQLNKYQGSQIRGCEDFVITQNPTITLTIGGTDGWLCDYVKINFHQGNPAHCKVNTAIDDYQSVTKKCKINGLNDCKPGEECLSIGKIEVQTSKDGGAGTDSPISMKICNGGTCCETGVLDSPGSDFDHGQLNTFQGNQLRTCEGFVTSSNPTVTIQIKGSDGWKGQYVKIELNKNQRHELSTLCPISSWLDDSKSITISCLSNECKKGEECLTIGKIEVKTSPNENAGTDSPISMKICKGSRCCDTGHLDSPGADFDQGILNKFVGKQLGSCDGFITSSQLQVTVKIQGSDGWLGEYVKVDLNKNNKFEKSINCPISSLLDDSKSMLLKCSSNECKPGEECFTISKVEVQTSKDGGAGTDSPISMKVCKGSSCCDTGTLDSPGSDFDLGLLNTYQGSQLGPCNGFVTSTNPAVTVKIKGSDGWKGQYVKIDLSKNKKHSKSVFCPISSWLDDSKSLSLKCLDNDCKKGEECLTIGKIQVKTSPNEDAGTDSPISMKFCKGSNCCDTGPLDSPESDFDQGNLNNFVGKQLGTCEGFITPSQIQVTVKIQGSDGWLGEYVKVDLNKNNKYEKSVYCPISSLLDDSKSMSLKCSSSQCKPGEECLTIGKIEVKTSKDGGAGTDSPISMKVCKGSSCCDTGTLDSPGSDFDLGLLNTYQGSQLGPCNGFVTSTNPVVTIKIKGSDGWKGQYVKIDLNENNKYSKSVTCPISSWLDDSKSIVLKCFSNQCKMGEECLTIGNIEIKTSHSENAGTDSPISLKICKGSTCCDTGPLDSPGADFDRGNLNNYLGKQLGSCEEFITSSKPQVTVKIQGSDGWLGEYVRIDLHKNKKFDKSVFCQISSLLDDSKSMVLKCSSGMHWFCFTIQALVKLSHVYLFPDECFAQKIEFKGHDLSVVKADSLWKCRETCSETEHCSFWTYLMSTSLCHLKDVKAIGNTNDNNVISGPKACSGLSLQ